jgi:hydrogenase-4 component F
MTYHSLAKPVSLFAAGTLAQQHSSSDLSRIGTGTFTRAPIASALLVLSAVIITGSPPFGMFFSEMTILRAGFSGPHVTATSVFLGALVVLFCGFAYQVGRIVLGPPRDASERRVPATERLDLGMLTTIGVAVIAVVSAFYLPSPMLALIRAATRVVWEGR